MNEQKKNDANVQGTKAVVKTTEETPIIKINEEVKPDVKKMSFEEISEKLEKLASLRAKRERLNGNLKLLKSFKIENSNDDDEPEQKNYQELTISDSARNHYSIRNANTIQHIINVIMVKSEQAVQEVEKQLVEIF